MIGKLAKFAGGNESVHSTASRQDFDFLARLAAQAGADAGLLERIAVANTAQEVAQMLAHQRVFFALLCEQAWQFARSLLGATEVDVVLVGINGEVLGKCPAVP
jgi:cobalt-precorrin-5B (C1)-methyltransferase